MLTKNFQMSKLGLEKEEEPEIKLSTFAGSQRKLGKSRKTSTCFIDYTEAFDCVDHSKMWEAFKDMGIPSHLACLLRNLNAGQEAIARDLYGTIDCFKIQKGVQHGCLLLPCLFNLYTSTSWEMPGWMSNKLETRQVAETPITSDMWKTSLMAESEEDLKNLLTGMKEESEGASLKLNIKILRTWHPEPLLPGK